jgi:hypothetical protein
VAPYILEPRRPLHSRITKPFGNSACTAEPPSYQSGTIDFLGVHPRILQHLHGVVTELVLASFLLLFLLLYRTRIFGLATISVSRDAFLSVLACCRLIEYNVVGASGPHCLMVSFHSLFPGVIGHCCTDFLEDNVELVGDSQTSTLLLYHFIISIDVSASFSLVWL